MDKLTLSFYYLLIGCTFLVYWSVSGTKTRIKLIKGYRIGLDEFLQQILKFFIGSIGTFLFIGLSLQNLILFVDIRNVNTVYGQIWTYIGLCGCLFPFTITGILQFLLFLAFKKNEYQQN